MDDTETIEELKLSNAALRARLEAVEDKWGAERCALNEALLKVEAVEGVRDEYHASMLEAVESEDRLRQQLAAVTQERDTYDQALQSLTAGGSEFAHEAHACVHAVRERQHQQHETILTFKQERDRLATQLAAAEGRAEQLEIELKGAVERGQMVLKHSQEGWGRVQDNNDVVNILSNHCGESGVSEGAVETLNRIIAERDTLTTRLAQVEAALKSCKDFITKNKRGNEYLWMEETIDYALTAPPREAGR